MVRWAAAAAFVGVWWTGRRKPTLSALPPRGPRAGDAQEDASRPKQPSINHGNPGPTTGPRLWLCFPFVLCFAFVFSPPVPAARRHGAGARHIRAPPIHVPRPLLDPPRPVHPTQAPESDLLELLVPHDRALWAPGLPFPSPGRVLPLRGTYVHPAPSRHPANTGQTTLPVQMRKWIGWAFGWRFMVDRPMALGASTLD